MWSEFLDVTYMTINMYSLYNVFLVKITCNRNCQFTYIANYWIIVMSLIYHAFSRISLTTSYIINISNANIIRYIHRSKLVYQDSSFSYDCWLTPCDVATDNDTIILTNYRRLHDRMDSIQNVVDLCCHGQGQCTLLFLFILLTFSNIHI